jgi:hypothetical protein
VETLRVVFLFLLGILSLAPRAGAVNWFPERGLTPRHLADPHEPLLRLTMVPGKNRYEAMLGSPLPILVSRGEGTRIGVSLEGAALLILGREGGFFPLRTVDGVIRAGVELERSGRLLRLRLTHISAHQADGDSAVSYRGKTYSREFLDLEAGLHSETWFVYAGGGGAWHAVPHDPGIHLFAGSVWSPRAPGPVAAAHLSLDRRRGWRLTKSFLAGAQFGNGPSFRAGLRYFEGNRPEGQYDERTEQYLGIEIQYSR